MYLMLTKKGPLFLADTTVNFNPTAEELAAFAKASVGTATELCGIEDPRIGMLSFSTKGSASHAMVDKVTQATAIAKEKYDLNLKVIEFEERIEETVNAKYAVAFNSGTSALHAACFAAGINKGDEVITTPITFAASANCIKYCGGNIFFCDINPETFLIDTYKLSELIKSKPKGFFSGIIPVDFAGLAVNLEEIKNVNMSLEEQNKTIEYMSQIAETVNNKAENLNTIIKKFEV